MNKQNIRTFLTAEKNENAMKSLRTLLLFGKNSATYKFALFHALMNQKAKSVINKKELVSDYLEVFIQHYQKVPSQFQGGNRPEILKFVDEYLRGNKTDNDWSELCFMASKLMFNHVFDAFQNVAGGTLPEEYKLFDYVKSEGNLYLTDGLGLVLENQNAVSSLLNENKSRWLIVATAWLNNVSPNIISYNRENNDLIIENKNSDKRINIRSAVAPLMSYQHGKCFYCNKPLDPSGHAHDHNFPDVDHFYPHTHLITANKKNSISLLDPRINKDGIWNLVLACQECNRGVGGKSDAIPNKSYVEKLVNRNLLFTEEHKHSFKEGVLASLNVSNVRQIKAKILEIDNFFSAFSRWSPNEIFVEQ
jgi:5-methylcytosine-specific restriction endonuclease McrA